MVKELNDNQVDQLLDNSGMPGVSVRLTKEQWAEVLGIIVQGSQLMCSQISLQQDGLDSVANLSSKAKQLRDEIHRQLMPTP